AVVGAPPASAPPPARAGGAAPPGGRERRRWPGGGGPGGGPPPPRGPPPRRCPGRFGTPDRRQERAAPRDRHNLYPRSGPPTGPSWMSWARSLGTLEHLAPEAERPRRQGLVARGQVRGRPRRVGAPPLVGGDLRPGRALGERVEARRRRGGEHEPVVGQLHRRGVRGAQGQLQQRLDDELVARPERGGDAQLRPRPGRRVAPPGKLAPVAVA